MSGAGAVRARAGLGLTWSFRSPAVASGSRATLRGAGGFAGGSELGFGIRGGPGDSQGGKGSGPTVC